MNAVPRQRLLIISHDVIGRRMAGVGIRYWELAGVLAADAEVTLAAPRPSDLQPNTFRIIDYVAGNADSLGRLCARADLVLANAYCLLQHPELAELTQPLMLDLYDPTLLENLELFRQHTESQRAAQFEQDLQLLQRQLTAGDAYICATERQRDLYLGALMGAGRMTPDLIEHDPLLRGLIDVVSFGLPATPPVKQAPALRGVLPQLDDQSELILWTGGLWDWMDPQTLIQAMVQVHTQRPQAQLVLLAGRHPGSVAEMRTPQLARTLAADLGLLGRWVHFYDEWVPYERRADFLLEADLLVSLHRPGLEQTYAAIRSRFLDHLWSGRASLVTAGDAAAALVEQHGLGRSVPPEDANAVAAALIELLEKPEERKACAANARALAADYSWERVAAPIRAFLAAPIRRRGHTPNDPTLQPPHSRSRESMDDQKRNEMIGRLDGVWKLEPQPLTSGVAVIGQAKELANSLTRWYVQAIVDQQNTFNATVVQALQALAANDDRRHSELASHIHMLHNHLNHSRQQLTTIQRRIDQIADRLTSLNQHVGDIDEAQTDLAEAIALLRELAATGTTEGQA
jgi:glycosyltransferase involved in cell wall biosynthesis